MKSILKVVLSCVRNFVAPFFCYHCKFYLESDVPFCNDCIQLIKPVVAQWLALEANQLIQIHAISAYDGPIKSLVTAQRAFDKKASRHLGNLIAQLDVMRLLSFDYIVPIPLHAKRERLRGYNQAQEMARSLSVLTGKPVKSCLRRTRATVSQRLLKRYERHENLRNAFELTEDISGKSILLVDDLMMSGATLYQASLVLRSGNPLAIHAVVGCYVIGPSSYY